MNKRRVWLVAAAVTASLLVLEVLSRGFLFYESHYRRPDLMRRIIDQHPERDRIRAALDAYQAQCGNQPFIYEEYYLYRRTPCSTRDITFTEYFSSRRVPDSAPVGKGSSTVWLFGGSTMLDMAGPDDLTIANTIARVLTQGALRPTVVNFGEGAFQSSLELAKFESLLRTSPPELRPTDVVFYDGFNDALFGYSSGPGRLQGDLAGELSALVSQRYELLGAFTLSHLLNHSKLWSGILQPRIAGRFLGTVRLDASDKNVADSVEAYVNNLRMALGVCLEFGIRCTFVLQPILASKQPLTPLETEAASRLDARVVAFMGRFYSRASRQLAGSPGFYDFSDLLDNSAADDFVDYGHVGPATSVRIGEKLGGILEVH